MAVLAHPDDESLGIGGTLVKYASAGVETHLLTATRGDGGRYGTHRPGEAGHPGRAALASIREKELRAAAAVLGVRDVALLEYRDGELDRANAQEAIAAIVEHLRRVQPDVVITFGPDGAYGHPDHIAISQFTTAAVVRAADTDYRVSKLYYIAWTAATWAAYQSALKRLTSTVDGVERQVVPSPEWGTTTRIDTSAVWPTVWRAVQCHRTQMSIYKNLEGLPAEHHRALWGVQEFYRAFSLVNGGRVRESDLFEGLR
jgi:LmbE family N-acetylglucosaminyl deacetylase